MDGKVVGVAPQIIENPGGLLSRTALVVVLSGQIKDWPWWWEIQSEIGIWNPDISLEFKTYYNFEKIDLTMGFYMQGYLGFYGTPAWLNHARNAVGLFLSHKI